MQIFFTKKIVSNFFAYISFSCHKSIYNNHDYSFPTLGWSELNKKLMITKPNSF